MRRPRQWLLFAALASTLALLEGASPQDAAHAFLTTTFGLSPAEIGRLDAGHVLTRTLAAGHSREVGTLGIVRIATTPETYVERVSDIVSFKRTEDVLQIGTFSDPPLVDDLATLIIPEDDIRRLQKCRVGDCGVRLSAEAIRQLAASVDWKAADAAAQAGRALRELLVQLVARYRENGTTALMTYADGERHLEPGAELAGLIAADEPAWRHLPDLRRHVLAYPHAGIPATEVVYWSKERVSKRPVVSITHLSIVRQAADGPVRYAISSRQVYAMHYFDASLGLTLLVPAQPSSSPATYVVYLNRSRIDLFDGMFGRVARRIVSGRARSLVGEQLTRLQRTLNARPPG